MLGSGLSMEHLFASIESTREETHTVAAWRVGLLPKLVSGKIRVGETQQEL